MMPDDFDEDRLTDEALAEYHEFEDCHGEVGCSCHIEPPCPWCTHFGNPMNLIEDDDAWQKAEPDVMASIREAARKP